MSLRESQCVLGLVLQLIALGKSNNPCVSVATTPESYINTDVIHPEIHRQRKTKLRDINAGPIKVTTLENLRYITAFFSQGLKAVALANLRSSKRLYFLFSYSLLYLIYKKKWVIFKIPVLLSSRGALKYSLFRRKLECCTSKGLGRLLAKVRSAGTVILLIIMAEIL